jgi:Ca2+/Na+ antiporter
MLELFVYILLLIVLFYILAHLVEHFMMRKSCNNLLACLSNISKRYNLSETTTGYILAFGSSIPEFTTNFIASTDLNSRSIVLGLGTISASGAFGMFMLI